jgi:hypothetical protein
MLQTPPFSQPNFIGALANLRKEWQSAAGDTSLLSIPGSVGLILVDLLNGLGMSTDVQIEILGAELFQEVQIKVNDSNQK